MRSDPAGGARREAGGAFWLAAAALGLAAALRDDGAWRAVAIGGAALTLLLGSSFALRPRLPLLLAAVVVGGLSLLAPIPLPAGPASRGALWLAAGALLWGAEQGHLALRLGTAATPQDRAAAAAMRRGLRGVLGLTWALLGLALLLPLLLDPILPEPAGGSVEWASGAGVLVVASVLSCGVLALGRWRRAHARGR